MKYIFAIAIVFASLDLCAQADSCMARELPSVELKKNTVFPSKKGKATLDSVVKEMKDQSCKIRVLGSGLPTEAGCQLGWDKTTSVIQYLLKKGIDTSRIWFSYDCESEMPGRVRLFIVGAGEDGPSTVPPPMPACSYHYKMMYGGSARNSRKCRKCSHCD